MPAGYCSALTLSTQDGQEKDIMGSSLEELPYKTIHVLDKTPSMNLIQ
jgi:hypothetical protein